MNNESTLKSVGSIFTGKGGTIRTAIVSIVILAVFGEIMDSKYQFTLGTSNGETMSLKPFVNSENNESFNNLFTHFAAFTGGMQRLPSP